MKEGNRRSGRYYPDELFPFQSARCARGLGRPGWMPRMLLMPLMRSTPGFWMPELSVPPPDGLYGKIAIPRLTARNDLLPT